MLQSGMITQDGGTERIEEAEFGVSQADRLVFASWHDTSNMTEYNVVVNTSYMDELPHSATALVPSLI